MSNNPILVHPTQKFSLMFVIILYACVAQLDNELRITLYASLRSGVIFLATLCLCGSGSFKRLLEVINDIINVLSTNRNSDQILKFKSTSWS